MLNQINIFQSLVEFRAGKMTLNASTKMVSQFCQTFASHQVLLENFNYV